MYHCFIPNIPQRLCVFAVITSLGLGCSSSSLNLGSRTVTAGEVQLAVSTNQNNMRSLEGDGTITVETPSIGQTGAFKLTLRKPDSVLVELSGPFGISIGTALVTRTEFLFYNSLQNKLITGVTDPDNLQRILRIRITFDDLMTMFSGGIFLEDDRHEPDETGVDDDQFVLTYTQRSGARRYWVDPTSLLIRKIQFVDRDGRVTVEQSFANFQTVDGVTMPYNIRITQPRERNMVALAYADVTVNREPVEFRFSIPGNAEQVRW